jgi:predicted ATPase
VTPESRLIKRLDLRNFKGFRRFTVHFRGDAFLVGPNNAGKSTLIEALRVCAQMLRQSRRRSPQEAFSDGTRMVMGYPFDPDSFDLVAENLRYEFRRSETRIELQFAGQHRLRAVWPAQEEESEGPGAETGFFYLEHPDGRQPTRPKEVRESFPPVGLVPVLSPVEPNEEVLTEAYVRKNLDARLASRHFRNQLLLLKTEWEDSSPRLDQFLDFAARWVPEVRVKELVQSVTDLDLYYEDATSRVEKEIYWAGDGIQIWLQLLLHLFRLSDTRTIVLDEPDVFLHPDLQRRLVGLLEETEAQTITATHSAEVLAEAAPESVIWIDRARPRAARAPKDSLLTDLSTALGTQFNLRLAKALTVRLVVFVEGNDARILRNLARTLGAARVATEAGMTVIPLRGFPNWERVEPFSWLVEVFLKGAIQVFVLLDRDYHSDAACKQLTERLNESGIHSHIWKRKELESYLLEPRTISRLSGAEESWILGALLDIAESLRYDVSSQFLAQRQQEEPQPKRHLATIAKVAQKEFDQLWKGASFRLEATPPQELLSPLNSRLEAASFKPVAFRRLSSEMRPYEIPDEMAHVLARIESLIE